ncbi:heme lyase CcmF/NrfE family subunit [Nocardia sp. NRRL S-836]|uniref:heme lyase CcmF/NrfE family subunit n=1 Tax=Nocardia sp. NRRL S-836 TaxID=1519492 RepID=UPI0006B02A14|nr:cytochrome c-type biogenesis CcmF C-terminal domain-containing protein [Nocardia sp. NRRL S-836]
MSAFGRLALVVALVAAAWTVVTGWSAHQGRPRLLASSRNAPVAVLLAVAAANLALLVALLGNDFTLRYVVGNSDRGTPPGYRALALWAGDEGSLLLWNLVLAAFAVIAARRCRPGVLTVLGAVQACYLVIALIADPFAASHTVPADGDGAQPLLRTNVLMAIHPPIIYCGLIALTVPFAVTLVALVRSPEDDGWVPAARRWMTVAWCFLTAGLVLGAAWAYAVLGWGGYWAWDPVENAALLPWLTATAYLHTSLVQQRRGLLRAWNPALVIITFALSVLGTFLTRGSLLTSVHSFASSAVGPVYLGLLIAVVALGFGLLMARSPLLRPAGATPAACSRESAVTLGSVLLATLAASVLVGTLYPLVAQLAGSGDVAVGKPFYARTSVPLLLAVLVLAGVGPLTRWRADSVAGVLRRLAPPLTAALVVGIAAAVAGGGDWVTVVAVTVAAFVAFVNLGAVTWVRQSAGGRIAHLGVALLACGAALSSGYEQHADVVLRPGAEASALGTTVRLTRVDAGASTLTAQLDVGGRSLAPRLLTFRGSTDPTGVPDIDRGWWSDTYVALLSVSRPEDVVTVRLYDTPGMSVMWLGGLITVVGGAATFLPRRRVRTREAVR